jgi:hypothetical protein
MNYYNKLHTQHTQHTQHTHIPSYYYTHTHIYTHTAAYFFGERIYTSRATTYKMAVSFQRIFLFGVVCIIISALIVFKLYDSIRDDPYGPYGFSDRTCNYDNLDDPACLSGRLAEYCAAQNPSGVEGKFSEIQKDFTLQHVVLNVRHGDRSAIHAIGRLIAIRFKICMLYRLYLKMVMFRLKKIRRM